MAKTVAYYNMATITAVKSFTVQAFGIKDYSVSSTRIDSGCSKLRDTYNRDTCRSCTAYRALLY
jgi:hypothetical protein